MKERLISFKTAKLAKEKGFPQNEYHKVYDVDGNCKSTYSDLKEGEIDAHTQSQLQKWFREKYKFNIIIDWCPLSEKWIWEIYELHHNTKNDLESDCIHKTYEDALEDALQKVGKIINYEKTNISNQ